VAGETGGLVSRTMTISNLSNFSQQYNLYPEEGSRSISVVPSQFMLAPQQTRQAVVRIRPGAKSWRANLNLVAYGTGQIKSNFRVGDGIKIPVFFNAPQVLGASVKTVGITVYLWLLTLFGFLLALALSGIVCWLYCRRLSWRKIRARHKISFI